MSGVVIVALITLALAFAAGLVAGIAFVIAVSVRRAEKLYRRSRRVERELPQRSEAWLDDDESDDAPRWPTRRLLTRATCPGTARTGLYQPSQPVAWSNLPASFQGCVI